jgi:hypothetical protein
VREGGREGESGRERARKRASERERSHEPPASSRERGGEKERESARAITEALRPFHATVARQMPPAGTSLHPAASGEPRVSQSAGPRRPQTASLGHILHPAALQERWWAHGQHVARVVVAQASVSILSHVIEDTTL